MKLTRAQERAMAKMLPDWQNALDIEETLGTLTALVSKGLIQRQYRLGSGFFPRCCIYFRLPQP